jgi:hypothetical protein
MRNFPDRYVGDINLLSEPEKLAAVRKTGWLIQDVENPSEAVQVGAVEDKGWYIRYITHPTPLTIKTALTDLKFIKDSDIYEYEVKRLYVGNELLIKKWLRYGETVRNQ